MLESAKAPNELVPVLRASTEPLYSSDYVFLGVVGGDRRRGGEGLTLEDRRGAGVLTGGRRASQAPSMAPATSTLAALVAPTTTQCPCLNPESVSSCDRSAVPIKSLVTGTRGSHEDSSFHFLWRFRRLRPSPYPDAPLLSYPSSSCSCSCPCSFLLLHPTPLYAVYR